MNMVVDVFGVIGMGLLIMYMLYLRRNRSRVMLKFKKGTKEYFTFIKLMDTKRLVGAAIIFACFLGDLVWEIASASAGAKSSPMFVTLFLFGLAGVVAVVVFLQQKAEK